MANPNPALKNEVQHDLAELRQVADEIRLKIHLASLDAKSAWHDLEKKLELLEEKAGHEGDHIADATRELARELARSFAQFKRAIV